MSEIRGCASKMTLGIDLGTTNSSVSVYYGGQIQVLKMHGEYSLPSVVRFPDRKLNGVQVGQKAKKYIVLKPNEVFSSVKSQMRNDDWKDIPEIREKYTLEGEQITPTDIASKILSELKSEAQAWESCDGNFERVVICVPANTTSIYKQNIKDAAVAAGFGLTDETTGDLLRDNNGDVLGIALLEEPTAASLAYGVNKGFFNPKTSKEQNILVYDLGGGTFDVTILHIVSEEDQAMPSFTPISTKGVAKLGGDDFDWVLAEIISKRICDETGVDILNDSKQLANKSILKFEAEKLKIEFSNGSTEVNFMQTLEINGQDQNFDFAISIDEFKKSIDPLVKKSLECVREAMDSAKLTIEDINRIVLVGGSSKAPWIREAIKTSYKEPYTAENVDTIVSQGAAYYGSLLASMVIDPVKPKLSHHYGVELNDGTFCPLFLKNSEFGDNEVLSATSIFYNPDDSGRVMVAGWATQENIEIETDEKGNNKSYALVSTRDDNGELIFEWLGEYEIQIPRKPAGQIPIELTLTIDKQNCIHVKAVVEGKPTEADWKRQ
jgi:molecular chaperone DnaK (HSP70)